MRNVTRLSIVSQALEIVCNRIWVLLSDGIIKQFIHWTVLFRFFRYFLDTFHPNTSYSSNKSQTIYYTYNSATNKIIISENNAPKI